MAAATVRCGCHYVDITGAAAGLVHASLVIAVHSRRTRCPLSHICSEPCNKCCPAAPGETAYVRRLIVKHHEEAAAKKLRIVPCCGFDSAPFDLGALLVSKRVHVCTAVSKSGACRALGMGMALRAVWGKRVIQHPVLATLRSS